MSILADIISSAQDGKLIENLAHDFGLTTEQTKAAVEALTPALALALRNATTNPQVLEEVVAGLVHPAHQAAFDDPSAARDEETRESGAQIVARLFGSAEGQIAQIAARDAGLRPDVISRLLPTLASVVLGGLFKSFEGQGMGGLLPKLSEAGALGAILSRLDRPAPTPAPPAGAPPSGGWLGALLSRSGLMTGLLGSLLGGGPRGGEAQPQAAPAGDGLEDALGQLVQTLNALAPVQTEQTAELQDVLNRAFPLG